MGWGCYKHECDATSEMWKEKVDALSNERLKLDTGDWGRDGEVCPFCWEEQEAELTSLREKLHWSEKDLEEMKLQFAIASRACGNWRTWPGEAESDHDHDDWKAATRAILERDELKAELNELKEEYNK